jgi:hypothetical protein
MSKITKEQAIILEESKFWEGMSAIEIAKFQMEAQLMCIPFEIFFAALKVALGRPIFYHELGLNWHGIKAELWGEKTSPSLEEIVNLIPEEKRILLKV